MAKKFSYSLHANPEGIVLIVILTVQITQTRWSPIMDFVFFPNTLQKRVPMYLLQQTFCLTLAIDLTRNSTVLIKRNTHFNPSIFVFYH